MVQRHRNQKVGATPKGRIISWILAGTFVAFFALFVTSAFENGVALGLILDTPTPAGTGGTGGTGGTLPSATATTTVTLTTTVTPTVTATSTTTQIPTLTLTTTVTPTVTATSTTTQIPTFTRVPASPSPTSSLPSATPGPTFTPVPTAAVTVTTIPVSQPTVAARIMATPPAGINVIDVDGGGRLQLIPTPTGSGISAVSVITPEPSRARIDPVILMPAPLAGERAVGIRFQPVPTTQFAEALPEGVTAARVFDFSVFDAVTGVLKTNHERPIEFVFPIAEADMTAAGNDPSRLGIFRINRTTGKLARVPCLVDLPARVMRCSAYETSYFVLAQISQSSSASYKTYLNGVVKNDSAVAGSSLPASSVSSFTIYNTSTSSIANVSATFYASTGVATLTATYQVSPMRSLLVYVPNITGLANGTYAVRLDTDQVISAVRNTGTLVGSNTTYGAASNPGVADNLTGRQFFVPSIYRNYYGFSSLVVVQNTDSTAATSATVSYVSRAGTTVTSETKSIPGGASATFDVKSTSVPDGFNGSAVMTSTTDTVLSYIVYGANGALGSNVGPRIGASSVYIPTVYNSYYNWSTSLIVQNVDSVTTDVTVTYAGGLTSNATVSSSSSALFYMPNVGLPLGYRGQAVVTSSNGAKIAVIVNTSHAVTGDYDMHPGLTGGAATVIAPALYKNYTAGRWVSSYVVQNIGSSDTTVTATYDNGLVQSLGSIGASGSAIVYMPNLAGIPDGYSGGATISSSNGSPLVVIVNANAIGSTLPNGDYLIQYTGITS